jgi:hypothetical protein
MSLHPSSALASSECFGDMCNTSVSSVCQEGCQLRGLCTNPASAAGCTLALAAFLLHVCVLLAVQVPPSAAE